MKTHAVILAGGAGTRFWPLSRIKKPKQLLSLVTENTMIEDTIARITPIVDKIAISTSTLLEKDIRKILPKHHLIVEPMRRDTGPAIALCAAQYPDEDILVFLPADHYIRTEKQFQNTLKKAMRLAQIHEEIVIIGIPPSYPATEYGYIEPGQGRSVKRFIEKPDQRRAKEFIKKGYLWNAGMFVVRAGVLKQLFIRYAPKIGNKIQLLSKKNSFEKTYSELPRISFDYAVMDYATEISYTKATFSWNDIGSFDALSAIMGGKNTTLQGTVISDNSHDNVIYSDKTVTLIDIDDLIVVDTSDALLLCPKSSAQKIKQLQKKLPEKLQ